MRLLIAEDDRPLSTFLSKTLTSEHYAVDVAEDGEEAAFMATNYDYDLMILDLNLPRMDGVAVLKHLRDAKRSMPVLVLTERNAVEDRVRGLDVGADDYLPKPFAFAELAARVRALLRRGGRPLDAVLKVEDLELSRLEHRARRAGQPMTLTPKEFALLEYLMRNAGRPVTRAMILEHVWDISFDTESNIVDVYINYVRKKIDTGSARQLLHTVRGVGYQLGGDREET
ncbi:MAG: response regulator transcription factor [Acidobacteria bacterium]|jgi:DNA-binding response OmpR family regulator|nr:response regulator transcription factor [Acidobacteriota bacterium]